jgi:hypothetical protein
MHFFRLIYNIGDKCPSQRLARSQAFMKEPLSQILDEFKVGGLTYSPSRNHLDHFTEGMKSALEVLVPVTQYIKDHGRTDMIPLKDQLVSSLKSGVDMMAEALSDSELEESESEEAAKRTMRPLISLIGASQTGASLEPVLRMRKQTFLIMIVRRK